MDICKTVEYLKKKNIFIGNVATEPINVGASGANLCNVSDNSGSYALKVSHDSTSDDPNRLAAFAKEYAFYRLNEKLQLPYVPKLKYSENSPEYGWILVMERLSPIPCSNWDRNLQMQAIDLCAHFNSLPRNLFDDLHLPCDRIEIEKQATEKSYHLWLNVIQQHMGRFDENVLTEIYQHLDVVCPILNAEPHRICHGDFHTENLLTDGKQLYLIDWQNIHIGKSAGDISFFISRGNGFGISMDGNELFAYYSEKLSEYTGEKVTTENVLRENRASLLLTTFLFWAYYLDNAPYESVAFHYNNMVEAYHIISN